MVPEPDHRLAGIVPRGDVVQFGEDFGLGHRGGQIQAGRGADPGGDGRINKVVNRWIAEVGKHLGLIVPGQANVTRGK